jgi:hypothetical protein
MGIAQSPTPRPERAGSPVPVDLVLDGVVGVERGRRVDVDRAAEHAFAAGRAERAAVQVERVVRRAAAVGLGDVSAGRGVLAVADGGGSGVAVDALVDAGKWPVGTPERGAWSDVWGAWLQAQRRAA